jgi:hypothetical protein
MSTAVCTLFRSARLRSGSGGPSTAWNCGKPNPRLRTSE